MVEIPAVKKISIAKITTDGNNPNVMDVNQQIALKNNIKKYGFLVPIITNKDYFDQMINPRLAALAEIAWCSEAKRSWNNFRSSLKNNLEYLSKMGWKFHNF